MANAVVDIKGNREKVLALLSSVNRPGMEKLINWIDGSTDFFVAPASTRFHGDFEGGLAEHSLNVYNLFQKKCKLWDIGFTDDQIIVCALLHDICKANFYVKDKRNAKSKSKGTWSSYPCYSVNDELPLGHGEKSVFMLERFMRLDMEEVYCIRWHMGREGEGQVNQMAIDNAWEKCKAAVLLHTADLEASRLLEHTIDYKKEAEK